MNKEQTVVKLIKRSPEAQIAYREGFRAGLNQGLRQAAKWIGQEAERWVQDSVRKRIEDLGYDIEKLSEEK